jgi:dihydrolipoamide dehydrogenase
VTVVELADQLMPGADLDLVKPLAAACKAMGGGAPEDQGGRGEGAEDGIKVSFEGDKAPTQIFDRVLVAVGRTPNGGKLDADKAGVQVERARLHPGRPADAHQRAAHLRHRRPGRPADAGAQGHARRQAGGRGRAGEKSEWVARVIPVGGLHRSRRSPGSA